MADATPTIHPTDTPASVTNADSLEPSNATTPLGIQAQAPPHIDDASTIAPVPTTTPSLRSSLSWKSFRSNMTLSERTSSHLGWAIAFLSVLFTIVALSPAFKSQSMTERALQLAEWTALKDFFEECREELAAGIKSAACLKVTNAEIPPPPNMKSSIVDMRRGLLKGRQDFNGTERRLSIDARGPFPLRAGRVLVVLALALLALLLLRLRVGANELQSLGLPTYQKTPEGTMKGSESTVDSEYGPGTSSAVTVRHPPSESEASLRRRAVRTHPIYRHTNLDEAIHAADLSEIRIRLQNGEDVAQHWPHLIYRLAISPDSPDRTRRLEVARLCLDFGADVNAVEGWNGQSALLIAIHFGNVDVAQLLIANGAMVGYSPPDSHLTALHRCVRLAATGSARDALAIMEMLFKHGAQANQVDRLNETPLHKLMIDSWYARHDDATFQKLFPIALCLVEHGATMPSLMKDKFIDRNPLYELVHAAIWERAKRIATGRKFKREWQLWTGMDEAELVVEKALKLRQEPQGKRAEWMDVARQINKVQSIGGPSLSVG